MALSQLPERFQQGPKSAQLTAYIKARYSQYGYKKSKSISYNREWKPDYTRDRYRWVENITPALRFVGKVHEIRSDGSNNTPYIDRALVDHTGWYSDNYQDETVWGEVYQLPGHDGTPRYVPAVCDPNNPNCAAVCFGDMTDDLRDAIRWADSMAEKWAESEREYQAKEAAKEKIEENKSEIADLRADFKALAKELRENCDKVSGMVELRKLIRREYKRMKAKVRKLKAEIKKLEDNYWEVVPGY